ncbi:LysR family transcriptional regulator [Paraburkholderia sp. PGU16]|uniref:LysR family transcriptional regulator n=1 Tax=Paraburkholderia largidicola TaxID=3014751 RepID=A0A7I8BZZ2_9BURK|nr:LysR family transcriptional regulator [Paraburkholderia sp. PGU16]BCF94294.1 LysR family transcriptional regulator [Paraburkholderia sp. PGU16]BEU27588.1 LysR family transcriptional regulator [Paraburkholderia sp. 22B1P]GJH34030.1 LysR family transcriptional regulator [Paraburkholderia hospita]
MLDNVTINQLRAFVAVCDQGSFSGAARELRRAQSAISHAISALESAFDVLLFERNARKATLTAAGRSLLPDARGVISRTEEMKMRAVAIAEAGVPQVSIAVDTYFPRAHLIECLRTLQVDFPTVAINLRMTTMQGGERLVLEGTCALAVTITDVPELSPGTIERQHLCEAQMVTVCAPSHPLAAIAAPIPREEFGRHIQLVVTDNQPDADKTQQGIASERQWLVNDLGAKHDLLRGSLCWGHMPHHLVAQDLANGTLVELQRRAWHMRPLTFMISQRRGYSFSECETRLIEFLRNPHHFPKDASQRSASRKGKKNPKARHA